MATKENKLLHIDSCFVLLFILYVPNLNTLPKFVRWLSRNFHNDRASWNGETKEWLYDMTVRLCQVLDQ